MGEACEGGVDWEGFRGVWECGEEVGGEEERREDEEGEGETLEWI